MNKKRKKLICCTKELSTDKRTRREIQENKHIKYLFSLNNTSHKLIRVIN